MLYLTAVTSSIQIGLATVDLETGECTWIGNFPNQEQITSSCFENTCVPPDHDVGVKQILKPEASGHAVPSMDMELLVKNYGINPETFDAQMEIIKCESSGEFLLDEDFSDGIIPVDWETDYWNIAYTNYAGGESPEAQAYRGNYGGQTYDNYIQTKPFDATGWEKITMTFKWGFEQYSTYGQYCNFFVKYRRNETSPWKDVSPWDNPLVTDYDGQVWTIDCYGFGSDLGENFSIKFEYIGYYYYFNYFWLDDVSVEGCGGCAEYAELEEDLTLGPGEEMVVTFPGWQPSEWHNESYQDTWEAYPVHGFVIMDGDQNPRNDNKWMLLELYYPWFYDVELTEIGSPQEARSMPAQTFPVEATMTNVGQFPMCCIPIDISIGAPQVLDTVFTEYDWPYGSPPNYYIYYPGYGSGWTDEHKDLSYYYGWQYYNYNNAGGDAPEAYLPYYYAYADYVFSSPAIDTSEYQSLQLNFLMYVNHFSGTGLYALEAGYSYDGETWYAAWHEEPSSSGGYEVSVPIEGGSETTYIGFWVKGNPYYFNYLYLDNVEVKAMGLTVEYTDEACQGPDLEPGESVTFEFDDWTPDFLAEETTAWEVPYIAQAVIENEGDMDPGNDIVVNHFELDYWHDSGIETVSSPIGGERGNLLWDNGDTDGTNGYSILGSPKRTLLDDFETESTWKISEIRTYMVAGPTSDFEVAIWSDDDGEPGELILGPSTDVSYSYEYTERVWFGYTEWEVFYEFEPIEIEAGRYWIEIWSGSGQPNAFLMIHADVWGSECWVNYDDLGFKPGSQQFGVEADLNFRLYGFAGGAPGIKSYCQPGIQDVDAIVENYGTFPELDLTCYEEIWEFITDPENGTFLSADQIDDIDLDEPLGGTESLEFDDFNFAMEGRYGIFLNMPDDNDDVENNNKKNWGVGVDDTKPESGHALDPADPTGLEDWYVSDVEVTLKAADPKVMDVSSGVKEIRYTIDDGAEQVIPGDEGVAEGTFVIHDDGDDILVKYWAIDNVGNTESKHDFTIDMDQTVPDIDLEYEIIDGNALEGWDLLFTADATDVTSGMDRVEFELNDVLQDTVTGPGPIYTWTLFNYHGGLKITIKAVAFDIAGLNNFDEIIDPVSLSHSYGKSQSSSTTMTITLPRTR